jgi:putative tricarboxylic transport membrane protein
MSEGVNSSPNAGVVRSQEHAGFAGGIIVAFAVITIAASIYNKGFQFFGPGLEPRVIAVLLGVLGAAVMMRKVVIRNEQDFYGGIALVGLAIIALLATADLQGMRGFAFGPATAPRLFAGLLALLGGAVAVTGLLTDAPPLPRYDLRAPALWSLSYFVFHFSVEPVWQALAFGMILLGVVLAYFGLRDPVRRVMVRGPIFLVLAVIVFAETIRPMGLVFATFVTVMVSALATPEARWRETVIWGVVLTIFCSLLFPYALALPFMLWPKFWY